MWKFRVVAVVIAVMATRGDLIAAIPATAPTTVPAAQPAAAANYSEPRKTIRSFLTAPDEAGLRGALVISPETSADVEAFLGVMIATTRLQKVTEAQFGRSAAQYFSSATQTKLDARLKTVDAAEVEIKGDTATVNVAADEPTKQSGATIALKKIGDDWKIDAAAMFGIPLSTKTEIAQRRALAEALTHLTDQTIKEIEGHKYASAADAYKEYWTRSRAAARALQEPASQPGPSTLPH